MLETIRYHLWGIPMLRRSGPIVTFLFCLFSLISMARSAIAEVTRIEFTSKQPYGTFRVGDYVSLPSRLRMSELAKACRGV
jgi:hypothetical protein